MTRYDLSNLPLRRPSVPHARILLSKIDFKDAFRQVSVERRHFYPS